MMPSTRPRGRRWCGIVNGINDTCQRHLTSFPNQVFRRLGDILAVPELTVASPFLNTNVPPSGRRTMC